MPLFQIGYRRYEGRRTSSLLRWLPITRTGLTMAWRSKLLRRLVFVSIMPFLYFGVVFFLIGRVTDPDAGPLGEGITAFLGETVGAQVLQRLRDDPSIVRPAVWSIVFAVFGAQLQLLIAGLVAAVVGPRLIADDLRSRAFLIYFARPVSRLDYVLGKAGVLLTMLATVTLLPSALLYLLSILFSPSLETVVQTAPAALTMVACSLCGIVPATLIVLAISSLTRQARFATAAWMVLCTFGPITHLVLQETHALKGNGWSFMLSLPHSVRALQLGLYDVRGSVEAIGINPDHVVALDSLTSAHSPGRAAVWLLVVSISCFLLLLRRVDAPTRI